MSIENLTLAHLRHFSSLFTNLPAYKAADIYVPIRHYICREASTNQLLFMQNKPNLQDAQMNVNVYYTKAYKNETAFRRGKNKPNSNPIKPNFKKAKMNVNSLITKDYRKNDDFTVQKNKPNSNPISLKPKMSANVFVTKDYENEIASRLQKNKPNSNPIKPNFRQEMPKMPYLPARVKRHYAGTVKAMQQHKILHFPMQLPAFSLHRKIRYLRYKSNRYVDRGERVFWGELTGKISRNNP